MRRGHPGIGNWRGENPRHFRPRSGGTPHFRPTVPFGPLEPHRFPPHQRYRGPRPYNPHYMHSDEPGPPDHERQYRGPAPANMQRPPDRGHHNQDRQMLPMLRMRVQENNRSGLFNNPNFFSDSCNVNNLGDVDHRKQDVDLRQPNSFGPHPISPWVNPLFERRYNNDQSPHKTPKHHNLGDSILAMPDYSGHRPPSSDHYSDTTTGPNNNNNPYSHSVDDTVDIVRKRLQNRDSQEASETTDSQEMDNNLRHTVDDIYQDPSREQPAKKRTPKQRQNIKSNCDKIKSKIVHQLFKMDKGKIHKLMDNPNSSSKFEYAISSLITESQNSLNRHMRSVAEKSLTANSSSDFVHDDNNTIYEDTFMRQMQGVLDPQDTVLLEDIKPLVLAELSKVLSLDDFERIDDYRGYSRDDQQYGSNYNEPSSDQYPHNAFQEHDHIDYDTEVITGDLCEDRKHNFSSQPTFEEPAPQQLFERRPAKKLDYRPERSRSRSTESWQQTKSTDNNSTHNNSNDSSLKETEKPRPLFESMNNDQLSDDDDPFADLDNQYHVAVDHNFIDDQEDGEIISPIPPEPEPIHINQSNPVKDTDKVTSPNIKIPKLEPFEQSTDITKEINTQLQSIAKSPLKLLSTIEKEINTKSNVVKAKQELQKNVAAIKEEISEKIASENVNVKEEPTPTKSNDIISHANESGKHTHTNSRKRSVDQKPAHRKEKRKKSSHSECQEAAKSILTMFYDNKSSKDSKHSDTNDKEYSDKYVKRKEAPKKTKEKVLDTSNGKSEVSKPKALEVKKVAELQRPKAPDVLKPDLYKKQNSNTSHSMVSPKDTSSSVGDQKSEKVKLTAIDMFSGIPKKGSHQSHKSTTAPLADTKNQDENKIKPVMPVVTSFARKLAKRHVGTQVIKKMRHKESQTPAHKRTAAGTQTDPVKFDKSVRFSTDPLERMKEIDMEIQMLLQEKFKLYNSMETKNKNSGSSLGTLGMAVLNVPVEVENQANDQEDQDEFNADCIAEDFTNLPVEELEQIALESLEVASYPVVHKRTRRIKTYERTRHKSESPARNRKAKTPNISLLEQIITDDRPIEEIISLDDLENTPVRNKKKSKSKSVAVKKKSSKKSPKSKEFVSGISLYNLKPCFVVIDRFDMNKYLKFRFNEKVKEILKPERDIDKLTELESKAENPLSPVPELESLPEKAPSPVPTIEETSNDIQIDMMDVSEDIVIGDEVKTGVADESIRVPISEEIILDNSQSSAELSAPEPAEGECKMYDYSTDDTLKRDAVTVTGNADAVLAIECIDNSFVAACLNGNVYHFSTDGKLLNTLRGSNLAITCLTIVKEKYGTTVYTGSLDSRIRYYDLDTGLEKGPECNVLSPIQTMDRAWDTVFVGTRTGFVLQFECKNNMLIPVSTVKFSEQSILALRAMKEGARKVLLVAARSDSVTIKDAQTGLLLRTLEGPKMTVYSLLFEDGKVYCGTSSHQIHVFDYASGSHVHAHLGGKGAVCLRARGGLVFAGCYDGCVYVYREAEARPLAQLRGPALMLLSLAIDGTKIIAGYKDRSLYIWKIPLAILQEMIL